MTAALAETRKIKYVATVNDEALPDSTDPDWEMEYIDIGNVESGAGITGSATYRFENAPSRARRRVRHGDVIVSTVRTYLQAIAAIIDPPPNLIVSTGFAVIRPLLDKLDPGFCRYALREPSFLAEVERRSVGVSYPAINSSDLAAIRIPFPPLPRQRAIAAYLDRETAKIDAMIAAKERLLALLAEKRRALNTHAVTRGLNPRAPMKDSGVEWLGVVPEHWSVERLAYQFHERDERNHPDLPLLEVSLRHGVILREFSSDKIEGTAADFNTYKVAHRGNIVFNKMRMWQGAVGIAPEDGLVSPDYVVAEPIGQVTSEYAGMLFRTPAFSAECGRRSYGLVWDRLRLYWEGFKNIRIAIPPMEEQANIVERMGEASRRFDAFETHATRSIELLRERRSALIAAAVTGQIDLEDVA
jgi:type I restriction enzyme S subunit